MYKLILFTLFVFSLSFSVTAQTKAEKLIAKTEAAEKKGDYKAAIGYLNDLLTIEPNNHTFYLGRATNYMHLGQFEMALPDLDQSINLDPTCEAYYSRSVCNSKLVRTERAIADANKALEMCGKDSELALSIYINRGSAKLDKRDYTGAYDDYMLAYAIDTNKIETLTSLGTVSDEIGKDSLALVYLMRAYRIDSTDMLLVNNIGFFYLEHDQFDKSLHYMNMAMRLDKASPYVWNNLGYCKHKMGDNKGAMEDINQSLKIDPTNSYAWRNRALVYLAIDNKVAACADLEKAFSLGYSTRYGYDVQELYNKNCK